jgi:succinate dehydrogenase / fumarate reductase cytochrome b subunit
MSTLSKSPAESGSSAGGATPGPRPVRPIIKAKPRGPWPVQFYSTSVGKKVVMAVTGLILLGFIVGHMIGNLKMYLGVESDGIYAIDHYGEWLRELGEPALPREVGLWLMRAGLSVALALHLHCAWALTRINHKARPDGYKSPRDYQAADFASRTMRWSGIIVLLFLVWHLADLTLGWVNPGFEHGEVYRNLDASLSQLPVAALYIVANVALGVHIRHGAWSLFQSLGRNNPRFATAKVWGANAFAALIVVGNVSFPLAVQFGIVAHPSVS